jgi:spore coat polysaccharide biosynthesis protein SpsF
MKVVAIIQARMSSTRLPGKVLLDLGGFPMLFRVYARTRMAARIDKVVVATTWNQVDRVIVQFCKDYGIPVTRGDEHDVLARYYDAAQIHGADIVVRITSDCPLIDPIIIDEMIVNFLRDKNNDYMSNTLPPRTFPRGVDVEIFNRFTLEHAWNYARQPYMREHVTPYIYENPDKFTVVRYSHAPDLSNYRLTVDTPEDYSLLQEIYRHFDSAVSWMEVVEFLEKHPSLIELNANIRQKELHE